MTDQPKQEKPKTDQELAQEFLKKYYALCEEYGLNILFTPAWKVSQDTGTWSTVIQTSVGRLPKA